MTPAEIDLLTREYFHLLDTVEGYGGQSLVIKGWSVTVALGGIFGAYSLAGAGRARTRRLLLVGAALATTPFWLLDALWKSWQIGLYPRLCAVEAALSGAMPAHAACEGVAPAVAVPGVMAAWSAVGAPGVEAASTFLSALTRFNVWLPHLPVFAAGLLLAWLRPPADP